MNFKSKLLMIACVAGTMMVADGAFAATKCVTNVIGTGQVCIVEDGKIVEAICDSGEGAIPGVCKDQNLSGYRCDLVTDPKTKKPKKIVGECFGADGKPGKCPEGITKGGDCPDVKLPVKVKLPISRK